MLGKIVIFVGVSALVGVLVLASFSWFSRKPGTLGLREGRLAPCPPTPNCVCSQDTDATHGMLPLRFEDDPATAWQRLVDVLARQPRCQIVQKEDDYLHAEFTSLIFRYVDDVEFHLDAGEKVIHFRSASRAGRSDLGVNRDRMETLRKAFEGS